MAWAQAADLVARGRFRAARRMLMAAGMPADADGLALLGAALVGLRDNRAALEPLRAALALHPAHRPARFHLARALDGLGLMHKAVPILTGLHQDAPDDGAVTLALVNSLRRDARYEDTVALVDRVAATGDLTADLLYHRGLAYHAMGDGVTALADLDRVLALDPDRAAAWFASHACVLTSLGLDAALERLAHAAACPGANRKYLTYAAAYQVLTGRPVAAADVPGDKSAILDGALALLPHLAPDARLFGLSADLLRFAMTQATVPGLVLEFGVRRGTSLRHIAAACGQAAHGFDSFEGLPEGWGNEAAGTFSTGTDLPSVPANVTLHKGWFQDSIKPFLAAHPGPVRLANIDCDIYSSTVTVLAALAARLVPGSVLVFDEFIGNRTWAEHEFKAFAEFAAAHAIAFTHIAVSPFTGQVVIRID